MTEHRISYAVASGVARLTLDNPSGRNAIDRHFVDAFVDYAQRCAEDSSVKVIVLAANGDFFSVGGDLAEFLHREADIENYIRNLARTFHAGVGYLHRAPAPIVLALRGIAAGGGFSLVCGADIVIAARSAKLTSAYTRTGLTPDGGATYFLPRIVGHRKAFEIAALNPVLTAEEAKALGIVTDVVEESQLDAAVEKLVAQMARIPSGALVELKEQLRRSANCSLEEQLSREADGIARQAGKPETIACLHEFFRAE